MPKSRSTLKHSVLGRHDLVEGRRRDPENLPSLGSISYSGDVLAGLQETSPFAFLNSLMFFIRFVMQKVKLGLLVTFFIQQIQYM